MRVLLAGNMARDAVIAERLAREGCELHIAASIHNPSLLAVTDQSEGRFYPVSNVADPGEIGAVAIEAQANLFLTNSDEGLAHGVVDEVARQAPGTLLASPDQKSSRLEWDKFEARNLIAELDEEMGTSYNPFFIRIDELPEILPAIRCFQNRNIEIVVKPPGLTGGKGVKVMGPHLADYGAVHDYAAEVLGDHRQSGVDMEEKLIGHEFTIQGFTDGKTLIAPPPTYDYPYREDRDEGPGTGGMGTFTMPPGEMLPFLDDGDYLEAIHLMRAVLLKQRERGRDFKGVLYGSFFKTAEGLKVTEFNARMGDPEGLNIVELLGEEKPLRILLHNIATGKLRETDARFKEMASTAVYLVPPDYAYEERTGPFTFELDEEKIAQSGCRVYFGAARRIGPNQYQTVGSSRALALTSRARTPWEAREKIHEAIHRGVSGPLQYRKDIGDHDYIRIDLAQ